MTWGYVARRGVMFLVVVWRPYTQLLINSVPQPDPEHQWGSLAADQLNEVITASHG